MPDPLDSPGTFKEILILCARSFDQSYGSNPNRMLALRDTSQHLERRVEHDSFAIAITGFPLKQRAGREPLVDSLRRSCDRSTIRSSKPNGGKFV
jgi:hypothetical protein